MDWFRKNPDSALLHLHVQPGAKKTEVAGLHGDCLKIRLAAPPVDGKANECLIKALAGWFGVPQRQVVLKSGETSRRKTVEISSSAVDPASLLDKKS